MSAKEQQVGGSHYKTMAIQPAEFIHKNKLPFLVGNAIEYLCRYELKNGAQDLRKAIHCIELLLALEYPPPPVTQWINANAVHGNDGDSMT